MGWEWVGTGWAEFFCFCGHDWCVGGKLRGVELSSLSVWPGRVVGGRGEEAAEVGEAEGSGLAGLISMAGGGADWDGGGTAGLEAARLEAWVRVNQRALVAYARALVRDGEAARELAQEALLTAWRFRARFDGQRGDLGAWVRGILRNKWRELGRRRRWEVVDEAELEAIEALHRRWEAEAAAGQGELLERVEFCIDKLPATLREVVHGTYFSGWTGPELSMRLQASEVALRKRLQRAREAVKACLERVSEEEGGF